MQYDVFISYSRLDQPFVRVLDEFLRKCELIPWYDERCLLPGSRWEDVIEDDIPRSRTFLTCISEVAMQKPGFFHAEQQLAANRALRIPPDQLFIIPVLLGPCSIPKPLRQYHVVNLLEPFAVESLLSSFSAVLGRDIQASAEEIEKIRSALIGHLGLEGQTNQDILDRLINDEEIPFQESAGLIQRIANSNDPKRLKLLLKLRTIKYLSYAEQDAIDIAIEAVKAGQSVFELCKKVSDAALANIQEMSVPGSPHLNKLLWVNKYSRYANRKNTEVYEKAESYIHQLLTGTHPAQHKG